MPSISVAPAGSGLRTKLTGLSDRAIAWLFISPTIVLLLVINIFPLLWTIYMSFTNFKANMGWVKYKNVGVDNYVDILTDADVWTSMQTTAHFVFWSILFEVVIGFGLALLINRKCRGHSLWTTIILLPMMLSPAVVGISGPSCFNRKSACSITSSASSPAPTQAPSK
jgi:multiple sugar transport system permease protein